MVCGDEPWKSIPPVNWWHEVPPQVAVSKPVGGEVGRTSGRCKRYFDTFSSTSRALSGISKHRRAELFSVSLITESLFHKTTRTLAFILPMVERLSILITGVAIVHTTGMPVVYSFELVCIFKDMRISGLPSTINFLPQNG